MKTQMDKRKRVGFQSALLVSVGVIVGAFGTSILAWWVDATGVAVLLMAVAAAGRVSRLWGFYALKNVEVDVQAERETLSAGQSVTLRYTLHNNKALPLVWLELCQDVPVRGCLAPDESFQLRTFSQEEADYTGRKDAYMRRFAFFMGWSEMSWETEWTGVCRGLYRPRNPVLPIGSGFGLTQSTGEVPGLADRVLVVWPKIVPVETGPFLRHVWSGSAGKAGWSEDPTVIKGVRAYQPGDPWKRIDWRTAARTDELMVRQFDTVTPLSVLFILDAASLEDKEDGISVLASLILALENTGVECGLALPATGERASLLLRPEDSSVTAGQCLFALSEFEAETATERFDETAIMACSAGTGQGWIVAGSAKRMSCPELAGKLSERGVRLLAETCEAGVSMTKEYAIRELRRKEVRP